MPTRLNVHVQPKAKSNDIAVQRDGSVKVRVTAAPEDGKATRAVLDLLAEALAIPKRDITVVSGERSRTKVIEVALDHDELRRRFVSK